MLDLKWGQIRNGQQDWDQQGALHSSTRYTEQTASSFPQNPSEPAATAHPLPRERGWAPPQWKQVTGAKGHRGPRSNSRTPPRGYSLPTLRRCSGPYRSLRRPRVVPHQVVRPTTGRLPQRQARADESTVPHERTT